METINVSSIDCRAFVDSLKAVKPNTSRGVNFVNEALTVFGKNGITHKGVSFVVENAGKLDDNEMTKWSNQWSEQTSSVKFKVGFVNESITQRNSGKFYEGLSTKLAELYNGGDDGFVLESIALNGSLNDWRINPEVYNLIRQSNAEFYTANQAGMRPVFATNPIGFSIETESTVVSAFDGIMISYDKKAGTLAVAPDLSDELRTLAIVVSRSAQNFDQEQQKFIFETAIGIITVSDFGLTLNGSKMSANSISQIAGEYYKLNQFLSSKKADIAKIDFALANAPMLAEHYRDLAVFSNILRTGSGRSGGEYLVMLDSGNYSIIRKHIEPGTNSFKVSIAPYTMLSDAIASITDKIVVTELLSTYSEQIASETAVRADFDQRRSALNDQIKNIDEAITLVTDTLAGLDENFVTREKIAQLKARKEALETRKGEKLAMLAEL